MGDCNSRCQWFRGWLGEGSVAQQLQCNFGHDLSDHSQYPALRSSSPVQQPVSIRRVRQSPSVEQTINRPVLKRDRSNGLYGRDLPQCQQRPPVSPTPTAPPTQYGAPSAPAPGTPGPYDAAPTYDSTLEAPPHAEASGSTPAPSYSGAPHDANQYPKEKGWEYTAPPA